MPDLAKPHLDFVGDDRREDQIFAGEILAFAQRQRPGDDVARMARVGLPVDIVVVHRADHVRIHERRVDGVGLEAGNERRARPDRRIAGHLAMVVEQDLRVLLLAAAQAQPTESNQNNLAD